MTDLAAALLKNIEITERYQLFKVRSDINKSDSRDKKVKDTSPPGLPPVTVSYSLTVL